MKTRLQGAVEGILVVGALFGLPSPSFAQVSVIISGGFHGAYKQLLPEFENLDPSRSPQRWVIIKSATLL